MFETTNQFLYPAKMIGFSDKPSHLSEPPKKSHFFPSFAAKLEANVKSTKSSTGRA